MKALKAFSFDRVNIGVGDSIDSGIIAKLKERKTPLVGGKFESEFDRLVRVGGIEAPVKVVKKAPVKKDCK